ncbi:MAG: class II aldolase/adducin family protein [Actinomycetota bacterium]|nr:class II aldolase/adducin family protein [Actinomycetota bacterium]
MAGSTLEQRRVDLALACRVMAHRGLVADILGHISWRVDADTLLMRCRSPREQGLRFTTAEDIKLIDLDGAAAGPDELATHRPPNELPIHTEILRARPEVESVVHVHPPDVVVAAMSDIDLVPWVGAYDIPAMRLAERGIPVHPRAVLISRADLATEMIETLDDADVVVLAGHGLVSCGVSPQDAMLKAMQVTELARLSLAVVSAGGQPTAISDADRAELPDLGAGFNHDVLWRHHLACLDADGWGLS